MSPRPRASPCPRSPGGDARPGLQAFRVGLGALQPQVIPPYLRLAADRLGPFSHVLLEINSSAYALHPLSTPDSGRGCPTSC
ncbi:MAG: hypothetical protein HZT43_19030 [Exiguobacterium profundum]|nr:MAG: hypothetical protein HZT43_19030 [Exiguobacterium profundum]